MEIIKDIKSRVPDITNLPFVFLPELQKFYLSFLGENVIIVGDNRVEGFIALRLFEQKWLRCAQLLYPPIDKLGNTLPADNEAVFIEELLNFLRRKRLCHRVVQPPTYAIFKYRPTGASFCDFGSYRLQLTGLSDTQLFDNLHGKHRNVIRSASKITEVHFGVDQLQTCHELYKQTMLRSKLAYDSLNYFETLQKHLSIEHALCAVVYDKAKKQPLGSCYMPYSKQAAYYLYGGSANNVSISGSINMLHWEVIKKCAKLGVRSIDYVGARINPDSDSKYAGLQRFKERFGGTLTTGYLWKIDLNEKQCRLFDMLLHVKNIMKRQQWYGDIIDNENKRQRKSSQGTSPCCL